MKVLVANLSAPEVARLGVEMDRFGILHRYVRPYVNKGRRWERAVDSLPGLGQIYERTLGRRVAPNGLPLHKVVEAGVSQDIGAAIVDRLPGPGRAWRRRISQRLLFAAERAVARRAGKLASEADIVVASYGTGRHAFIEIRRHGGRAVLNYPIAHNRYQARVYAEEAELAPAYAAALPQLQQLPAEYSQRLEDECAMADRILVGSSFVQQSFTALGYDARKISVIPYGVDTGRFSPRGAPRADGRFRVLFVGQLGQRKGLSYLLEAYRLFQKHDTELQLVGNFVCDPAVYAAFVGLYRHTPHMPQPQLPSLLRQADVFVFPSLIEGMPLTVLESMACGVPVITTTHGSAEIVRDGVDGFFVPIRDPEAIAMRLEQLYRDRALREQMGVDAREQALRHTWQVYAERARDVIVGEVRP